LHEVNKRINHLVLNFLRILCANNWKNRFIFENTRKIRVRFWTTAKFDTVDWLFKARSA